jgi:hypothetical protein
VLPSIALWQCFTATTSYTSIGKRLNEPGVFDGSHLPRHKTEIRPRGLAGDFLLGATKGLRPAKNRDLQGDPAEQLAGWRHRRMWLNPRDATGRNGSERTAPAGCSKRLTGGCTRPSGSIHHREVVTYVTARMPKVLNNPPHSKVWEGVG